MKKLYLTSKNLSRLTDILPDKPSSLKLLFISTAANNHPTKWFVEKDRNDLENMGFIPEEMDIAMVSGHTIQKALNCSDVVHFIGGNSFYLLDKMRRSGFDVLLTQFLDDGGLYSGSSAGAVVVGISIEPVSLLDDPKEAPDLKSTEGLGLVDRVILPHYESSKEQDFYKEIIATYDKRFCLQNLTDRQALFVEGEKLSVVDTG